MFSQRYTRLPGIQQSFLSVLLGGFVFLLINSGLLYIFDHSTSSLYMSIFLVHVGLGLLITVPVLVFIIAHVRAMPLSFNPGATAVGAFTALSLLVLIISGIVLFDKGATFGGRWFLRIHLITCATTVLGFISHVSLKKGIRYHFLSWSETSRAGIGQAIRHPLNLTLAIGLALTIASVGGDFLRQPKTLFIPAADDNPLAPAEAVISTGEFLEEIDLSRSKSCGQAGCHPDVYAQWEQSVHHFSSFNNDYYRETIELLLREREGVAEARWCASCHDPLVLFTGELHQPEGSTLDLMQPVAQAGITCLSCHAVEGLRDVKGNGRFVIDEPDEYPFARTETGLGKQLHDKLIRSKPEPHKRAMLKPMHLTPEFCGTCHKVGVPPVVNDYRWKRGQNQYDAWHASGVSGNTIRSFYVPAQAQTCTSCHMPLVPSMDQGNDNGLIRSHRFAAANTTIPMLNNHGEQLDAVSKALGDSAVTLDLVRITVNGRVYGPESPLPRLRAGDDVHLSVVIRNRKVGHRFPAGTNDSNELWLELTATDAAGDTILASGLRDDAGHVDSTAHFLAAKLVSKASQLIARRDIQNWAATVYAQTITPGTARNAYYRFKVPAGATIDRLSARLNYRKFQQTYHEWVFRNLPAGKLPLQPITKMAEATWEAGKPAPTLTPLWIRWNDLGIGKLLEGDTRGALAAFQKVTEVAADNPEGPINLARVLIAEGQVDRAAKMLDEADLRRPGYLKSAYFRGEIHKAFGDYELAIEQWLRVAEAYPNDRVLLLNIGRLFYLLEKHEESLEWFDRLLTIDPEDLGGLYNRMLALGAMGRENDFSQARERYEYHKLDEAEQTFTADYKKKHPSANNEAQDIHEHRLFRPDRLSSSARSRKDGQVAANSGGVPNR